MTIYFNEPQSMYHRFGDNPEQVLKVLAERYIGANPQADFVYRKFQKSGILQNDKGLYDVNLGDRFPNAKQGQVSFAAALVWGDEDRNLDVLVSCYGPVRFWFNDQLAYRSTVIDEIKPDATVKLSLDIKPGWNTLLLELKNTAAGFGCQFGSDEGKVRILNVLAPFQERKGSAGWVFSTPVSPEDVTAGISNSLEGEGPDLLGDEGASGLTWLPEVQWSAGQQNLPVLERMFGQLPGQRVYAWTRIQGASPADSDIRLSGHTTGPLRIWLQGKLAAVLPEAGSFDVEVDAGNGTSDLLVCSECSANGEPWQFNVEVTIGEKPVHSVLPWRVHGVENETWLYAGPFEAGTEPDAAEMCRMDRIFAVQGSGSNSGSEHTYWRLDGPEAWVRPYYENAMLSNKWTVGSVTNYGRWDYPLGVTVYGLLQTGRYLNRLDMIRYATEHVQACTTMYEYSLWDRQQYGFPAINQQLVMMKMLDNCGSFGSAMLESFGESEEQTILPIADMIADFMLNKLERREDGAFYRKCPGEYSENTMWADDLYMSTPFLVRYARLKGDSSALDEAAKQFLLFRSYLFMTDQNIMSHVYDFKYGQATRIPWGRGNGWTLFSLSEVLAALPEQHPDRPALITFFNELCEGYAAIQADSGLWHQVLNEPDTYEEASCTAMFAYGFARGVRFDWLKQPETYIEAAQKAWQGLTRVAIDRQGNVHGVCSGSRYAFTSEYYNKDLLTVTNDNHGIGIMMLAGTEVARMQQHLEQRQSPATALSS